MQLENLYKKTCNSICQECSQLDLNHAYHTYLDYENYIGIENVDVLFLTDSIRNDYVGPTPFKEDEAEIFTYLPGLGKYNVVVLSAIKCSDIQEKTLTTKDMDLCRNHLATTIEVVKPKLIIPLGNLAFKMLTKKSGIQDKHGKTFDYEGIKVVPTFHPLTIILEPQYRPLFVQDVTNAINKYIELDYRERVFPYDVLDNPQDLSDYSWLFDTTKNIAVDIETTGLNFLTDKMMTIAISWGENTIVIPYQHRQVSYTDDELLVIRSFLRMAFQNPNNKKIFQNASFDLKFLLSLGIECINVFDTKLMHHSIDENRSHALKELVKEYFPREVEEL